MGKKLSEMTQAEVAAKAVEVSNEVEARWPAFVAKHKADLLAGRTTLRWIEYAADLASRGDETAIAVEKYVTGLDLI